MGEGWSLWEVWAVGAQLAAIVGAIAFVVHRRRQARRERSSPKPPPKTEAEVLAMIEARFALFDRRLRARRRGGSRVSRKGEGR